MKYFTLFIVVCNFLSYLWSVIGVFKKHNERNKGYYVLFQINSLLIWTSSVVAIYLSAIPDQNYIILSVIQTICLILFWMSTNIVKRNNFSIAFSKDKPQKLIKEGLYRRIRHPFYAIYLTSYFSIAILINDWVTLGLSLLILILYYKAARLEEGKFSQTSLANEYAEYKKETYMFFPKFW